MSRAWLDSLGAPAGELGARFELKPGLTMLGGLRGDLAVPGSGSDCVHLWSEPPKLIFVGATEPPRVNGRPALEVALRNGDRVEWHGLAWSFGYDDGQAHLEEVAAPAAASLTPAALGASPAFARVATPAPAATSGSGEPAWRRLKAGIIAELSLGDRAVVQRWQDAVVRGEFDPDAAARDLLASAPDLVEGDSRVGERSTRLMRDLLMSSVTRNPTRQIRKAARHGLAFVVAQFIVVGIFTLMVLAALLIVRTRGHSIDSMLDRFLDLF